MKELTLDAIRENLNEVIGFVDTALEEFLCPMNTMMQLEIAVEEIFINIASYAYYPKTGIVTIRVHVEKEPLAVEIVFSDYGKPYNPLEKEDPDITLSAEDRQIGGLGIYMVKKSMDDMIYEYKDGQNILTIVKKI